MPNIIQAEYRRSSRRFMHLGYPKQARAQWGEALRSCIADQAPPASRPTKMRNIIRIYAQGWLDLFNDRREAGASLRQAEKCATSVKNWIECAYAWSTMLGRLGDAHRCLVNARNVASVKPRDLVDMERVAAARNEIPNVRVRRIATPRDARPEKYMADEEFREYVHDCYVRGYLMRLQ